MTDLPTLDLDPEELDPIETASRDQITALQTRRLAWSLKHAYDNVPHYRAAFDAAGVHPDDFNSLADLAKFPFTSKQDLRDNYPFGMFAVPRDRVARLHASSGTTGKPTVVGYTATDIENWSRLVARSIRAGGGKPGMMAHIAMATACSPAASARITARRNSAAPWCQCRAGKPKSRCS